MSGEVTFDAKEWEDMIRTIDKNVTDPKPMLRAAFGTRGFKDVIDHFQNEEGRTGSWKPSQRAIREGGKTLQDTGNLRQNFNVSNIRDKGKDAIVFFNPTPYAAQHDLGTDKLPQREFMFLTDDAQEDMLKIILDLVVK